MRLAYIAVLVALAPGLALAAPKETAQRDKDCSTIKSITVRQACLDRQTAEHPGQQQQSRNMGAAVDDLKREDDLLAKKLKGICRGC